jgi:hypothetical protein
MAIYPPTPKLSVNDKRLLALMGRLLLERLDRLPSQSNLSGDQIALTDAEAEELLQLLEQLVSSSEFKRACFFIEELSSQKANFRPLREIYLSARKQLGRSRAVASMHWSDFLARLGIRSPDAWHIRTIPMSLDHFHGMERKLLASAQLNPRVVSFVLKLAAAQDAELEAIRTGNRSLVRDAVRDTIAVPLSKLRSMHGKIIDRDLSATRIAAAMTVICNSSVLFTTRDWSVTGTLSTMAGALAGSIAKDT